MNNNTEQPTLILARGVSGSGKSTLAKRIFELSDEVYEISTDKWFLDDEGNYNFDPSKIAEYHQQTIECCNHLMGNIKVTKWKVIIVHNTFVEEWEMTPYFELAEKHGWKIHTIIVENRHGGKNTHEVPEEALDRQEQKFNIKLS